MRSLLRSPRFLALACVLLVVAAGAGIGLALALESSGTGGQPQALDLHPAAGGFEPDRTRLGECRDDARCLEQAFGNVAYYEGPRKAIRLFDRTMQADSAVEADCHRIAHTIGSAALARSKGNVAEAFAQGSSTCWSGYYHGILERSFQGADSRAAFTETARSVCADAGLRRNLWLTYQCVHGLGHGLMIQSGYNLPLALGVCDRLATAWDQTSCTGGVFMENIAAGQTSAYGVTSPWLKDDDLVYPCNWVAKRHRLYCYLMLTSRVLQANGYDWKATARVCAGVEATWVVTCFESFGRDADGFTRQDPARVIELCRIAGAHERDCVYGAARDMTSNYAGGERTSVLCRQVAARYRATCFNAIGTILGTISQETAGRRRLCGDTTRAAPAYLGDCLRGAGVPA